MVLGEKERFNMKTIPSFRSPSSWYWGLRDKNRTVWSERVKDSSNLIQVNRSCFIYRGRAVVLRPELAGNAEYWRLSKLFWMD